MRETPTQTGIDIPSTAASLALSHSSASPMKATQPPIVSIETSSRRSHIRRGTPSLSRRASAIRANAAAPTMPHSPRDDSGGHSVSRCFMIGKLRPHPTDAMASKTSPSGDIRARPASRGTDMVRAWIRNRAEIWFRLTQTNRNSLKANFICTLSYRRAVGCSALIGQHGMCESPDRRPRKKDHRAARSRGR